MIYEIDLNGITNVEGFYERIRAGIPLPGYFGENLDALADAFSEISGRIIVKGSDSVDQDMIVYVDKFKTMCIEAHKDNALLEVIFL